MFVRMILSKYVQRCHHNFILYHTPSLHHSNRTKLVQLVHYFAYKQIQSIFV